MWFFFRLRGAVYFGYGIMNIVLSLIPPKLMKLANLFGFSGDRRLGLQALEFASQSQDMKAPLARLVHSCNAGFMVSVQDCHRLSFHVLCNEDIG